MSSWRDDLPPDLPREQMMAEAVARGGARRRRRQRLEAAVGGSLCLLVTGMVAAAAMSLSSRGQPAVERNSGAAGAAGADSSAGSTQQLGSISPEESQGVAPALPSTTVAAAGAVTTVTVGQLGRPSSSRPRATPSPSVCSFASPGRSWPEPPTWPDVARRAPGG